MLQDSARLHPDYVGSEWLVLRQEIYLLMLAEEPARPREALRTILHHLWSKSVGQKEYQKRWWIELQGAIWNLAQWTPPLTPPPEPEPWGLNGH